MSQQKQTVRDQLLSIMSVAIKQDVPEITLLLRPTGGEIIFTDADGNSRKEMQNVDEKFMQQLINVISVLFETQEYPPRSYTEQNTLIEFRLEGGPVNHLEYTASFDPKDEVYTVTLRRARFVIGSV